MKRIITTMIAGLACITTAFAQTSEERVPAKGFAMFSADGTFRPYEFTRHAVGENDIQIEILYAVPIRACSAAKRQERWRWHGVQEP